MPVKSYFIVASYNVMVTATSTSDPSDTDTFRAIVNVGSQTLTPQ